MISPQLSEIGDQLRRAAGRRAYADAEHLLTALGPLATAEIRALPEGDPRLPELEVWLGELLGWTEVMLRTGRAADAVELRRMPFVKRYLQTQNL